MRGEIVVCPRGGLCNRLRVVSSFAVLARRCERDLKVCWTSGAGWSDEDLEDLFENRFSRVAPDVFESEQQAALCLHDVVGFAGVGGLDRVWGATGPGFSAVFDPSAYPVITYHGCQPCHELIAPEQRRRLLARFKRDFTAHLRAWRPVAPIRERIERVTATFDAETVGVHIRRGDVMDHPTLSVEYGRSTDAAFMARMDRIRSSRPGSSFFLATDSVQTQHRFRERYGDTLRGYPEKVFVPSVYGAPKANQRDAVVDLFALAQTRTILGSNYSTFSSTAAILGGRRLHVVVEDSGLGRLRRVAVYGRNELVRRVRLARTLAEIRGQR